MNKENENKPLSEIPEALLQHMRESAEKDIKKFQNPVDFIVNERKKHQIEVTGPTGLSTAAPDLPPMSEQPKVNMIAVDGQVLPGDSVTMMLYALVTLAKNDKKLAKLLRTFKFKMKNVNGEVIWE